MKLSDILGQVLSMFETHTAAAAHVNDTVAATSMGPIVNAMKASNEALRQMVADTQAEEEPEDTAEPAAVSDPDSDTVDIPPGHDAEVDALRAVADDKGVKYNMRMRAAGLRKALGMTADESVTVDPKQLPDDMQAQVADEMSAQEAADNSADELNAEEAARHAQG